jgi:cell division protein FtsI (penicillin-binding protein 3)
MNPTERNSMRLRILLVGLIFSLCMTAIGAKAVYLQLFCESWLSQKAADQYEKSYTTRGQRGTIYDRNHGEMALSIDVTSIAANPAHISDAKKTSNTLSKILKIDSRDLDRKLGSEKPFVWLKRQVTPKEAKVVQDLKLSGISFQPEFKRFYPNRAIAAQVLGFSGIDGQGLEGIEYYYNSFLKSDDGDFKALTDALGRKFDAEKEPMPDYSGNNLILTIDRTIQYISEKALEDTVSEFSAKSGIAIVMNPETGAILALAHYPFFNPNSYRDFGKELWRNRAITDQFEPGSTMKIFLAAAALESGICSPNTIFFCENGNYTFGKNTVHDIHPRGWLSLQQIIKYSSNIGAVKVGERIGPELLFNTLRDFGFGEKTGFDCPGETSASLASYKRWAKIDAANIAFGQGVTVSALQILTAASAIANNGVLMRPYIVQAATDQNGRIIQSFGPKKVRRVISAETAGKVLDMMKSVVSEEGTGAKAAIEGYSVCGKTGTAQKIDDKGTYSDGKYIASFIGFVPAEKPEISVMVVIDEPEKNYYGGIVATRAFRKIARETLDYTNVLPKSKKDRMMANIYLPPETDWKTHVYQ